MYTACDGALWLQTDQGIAKLENDIWTVQLAAPAGKIVGVDNGGRIWAVGEDYNEISAWDGSSWEVYGAEAGWTPVTYSWYRYFMRWGQCDPAGRFWLATTQDIRSFDGERWTVFTPEDMGMSEVPYDSCEPEFQITILESTGDVWIGECEWAEGACGGQGVRWFDGSAWRGSDSPVSAGCVAKIEEDSTGNIWLGLDTQLWRYTPTSGDWTSFAPPEEVPFGYRAHGAVTDLAADPFGRLWMTELLCGPASCDANALYLVQDGVWTLISDENNIYNALNLHIVTDAAGATWLLGGITYRLTETSFEPAAYLDTYYAAMDENGRVWFILRDYPHNLLGAIDVDK